MAIDALTETIQSLHDATASCPKRHGKKAHISTPYRWTTIGCRGVVLESIQIGGTRCTSREALARFFQRLTARVMAIPQQSECSRADTPNDIEQQLDSLGIQTRSHPLLGEALRNPTNE